jgi:hypothetical protein
MVIPEVVGLPRLWGFSIHYPRAKKAFARIRYQESWILGAGREFSGHRALEPDRASIGAMKVQLA